MRLISVSSRSNQDTSEGNGGTVVRRRFWIDHGARLTEELSGTWLDLRRAENTIIALLHHGDLNIVGCFWFYLFDSDSWRLG